MKSSIIIENRNTAVIANKSENKCDVNLVSLSKAPQEQKKRYCLVLSYLYKAILTQSNRVKLWVKYFQWVHSVIYKTVVLVFEKSDEATVGG